MSPSPHSTHVRALAIACVFIAQIATAQVAADSGLKWKTPPTEARRRRTPHLVNYCHIASELRHHSARELEQMLAQWDVIILFPFEQVYGRDLVSPDRIRALNPDIVILVWMPLQGPSGARWRRSIPDSSLDAWRARDKQGEVIVAPWGEALMNPVADDRGWPRHVAAFLDRTCLSPERNRFDGVMLDCLWPGPAFGIDANGDGTLDGQDTDAWRAAYLPLLERLRQQHPQAILVGNAGPPLAPGDPYLDLLNGSMHENALGNAWGAGEWRQVWDGLTATRAATAQHHRQPMHFIIADVRRDRSIEQARSLEHLTAADLQRMRLGLCTSMLVDGGYFGFDRGDSLHGQLWWFDEYDANIGAPAEACRHSVLADGVYSRRYESGVVLVNPTRVPISIDLGATYVDYTSKRKARVHVIPPHDGRILTEARQHADGRVEDESRGPSARTGARRAPSVGGGSPSQDAGRQAQAAEAGAANLLPNASFDEVRADGPVGWRPVTWSGRGDFEHAWSGYAGGRCVSIASIEGADVAWACTMPVEPYAKYRLTGWIRTEKVEAKDGRGALLNVHDLPMTATTALTGTKDWTRVAVEFETGGRDALQINCLFGGWGWATGRAWYDEVRLEQIGRMPMPAPRIKIDASRTGEPISKYIYGQFIEHLGRCIYGGIWAEMLEDRKFFHPVGSPESPWAAVGGADAVGMVHEGAFVGEHMPRIRLRPGGGTRGLAQRGLSLIGGREYVGRIWLRGTPTAGPVSVSLIWGGGPAGRQVVKTSRVGPSWVKTALVFRAGGTTDDGRLEITAAGSGQVDIGPVSVMLADHVEGMRADTLGLLRELNATIYRWPGGNFVSGYDWRDGVGDPDRRPPRRNPAWRGIEPNDFGLDEFVRFCRQVGAEPYITVNSGLGEVAGAVAELEYANGGANTEMGRLRAAHGHAAPYGVRYWGIGNEMYGDWQLGHMPLKRYIKKHRRFADALGAADPSIRLIGVGSVGDWSVVMLRECAGNMDLISEHFYCGARPGLYGHVEQIPAAVQRIAEAHRGYRAELESLRGRDIRLALDEWNYWYGPHVFGELGTRYFLKDALGIAAGLHALARNSDLYFMANYAQTVNVIGCIKTSPTAAAFETTGLVLKLYRAEFGVIPLMTTSTPLLDAQAALSADRRTLTIGIVNAQREAVEIELELHGARLGGGGTRWQIAGGGPEAFNEPARAPAVVIERARVTDVTDVLPVAACSVSLYALEVE